MMLEHVGVSTKHVFFYPETAVTSSLTVFISLTSKSSSVYLIFKNEYAKTMVTFYALRKWNNLMETARAGQISGNIQQIG